MEDSTNRQVITKLSTGRPLYKKVFILTIIMLSFIVVAVAAYSLTYLSNKPKIDTLQGSFSAVTAGPTDDACSDSAISKDSSECVVKAEQEIGSLTDLLNSL